ncbi:unnamed protein product, partial [Coregonus sp. 'balchen']
HNQLSIVSSSLSGWQTPTLNRCYRKVPTLLLEQLLCVESEIRGDVTIVSQALKIGDNNVIESKADLGKKRILTSGCIVGACCQVNTCEVIPENTVIYGSNCMRRVQTERPQPQTLQLDFLMKILPNYHHMKKTAKGTSTPVRN